MAGRRALLRRTFLVLVVTVLPTVAVPVLTAPAAAATACSGVPHDVDGDGFADVAVGEPGGGSPSGGRVHVFFGTADGPTASSADAPQDLYLAQGAGGVPGTDQAGDLFGAATAFGDFDADGCADLAIGVPGNSRACGAVVVLFGSPAATFSNAVFLTQDSVPASGSPGEPCSRQGRPGERFGAALAVGDLDGSAPDDLVVGAPGDTGGAAGGRDRGAVSVFYGASRPGTFSDGQQVTQNTGGLTGTAENGDRFGAAVAVAASDLLVGVPGENGGTGIVHVIAGRSQDACGTTPLCLASDRVVTQQDGQVPEPGDNFGAALAVGDVTDTNADRRPDVVVGVPGENRGAGQVLVLIDVGVGGELSEFKTAAVGQNSAGVDGVAAAGDRFGASVAVGALDSDTFADIVVGAPLDDVAGVPDAGSVTLLRGASGRSYVAGYGGTRITQDTAGVPGSAERGDRFGRAVAVADVTRTGFGTVLVGSSGEDLGGVADVGSLTALAASPAGPVTAGSRLLEPGAPGVLGVRRTGAGMGAAVG